MAGGASIDFAMPPRHDGVNETTGFTPLMIAASMHHAGVAKVLLKGGAGGTKTSTQAPRGIPTGTIAIHIARGYANGTPDCPDCAETLVVLRRMSCCSWCGVTSAGLCAATPGEERRLKRCSSCPARGPAAWYCAAECQRADWLAWHREECAEARRARQAAGAEV